MERDCSRHWLSRVECGTVEAALKTGKEKGWKAAGASQEDLESALETVKKIVDDEKAAAHKSQTELDVNMTQALAKVTKNGNVTGLAIGNWFGKIAGTVVGDKMLSVDKSNPNRRVNQVIIERI